MRILIFVSLLTIALSNAQNPSMEVQPFLEHIVSLYPNVRDTAISPDQNEIIFTVQSLSGDISALIMVKHVNGNYTPPELLPFSGQFSDLEPFYSNDGLQLYFVSNRPLDANSTQAKDYDIWLVSRATLNSGWSKPINLGSPVNTKLDEFYPTITSSGNLYFTLDDPSLNEKDNIYMSEYVNGVYTKPIALGSSINSEGYEFNAFVAPNESLLIYTCYNREDGYGSGDLYISYKDENGNWSKAKNMGETVNSNQMDYCPFLDGNNNLYFTSRRFNSHKDTTARKSLEEIETIINSYSNGLSRLYIKKLELD